MNELPLELYFKYDIRLIEKMDYIWERTGVFPDIREIAEMDLDAIDDLMRWDIVKAYLKTQARKRTG